uniref:PH domain-containing protein n=1 Tax=Rhizochromulina marina TaxID=1034831 RepID=A0A7S2SVR3_9STRA
MDDVIDSRKYSRLVEREVIQVMLPRGMAVEMRGPVLQLRGRGRILSKVWKTVWLSLTAYALVLRKGELEVSKLLAAVDLRQITAVEKSSNVRYGFLITSAANEELMVLELGTESASELQVWLDAIHHNRGIAVASHGRAAPLLSR